MIDLVVLFLACYAFAFVPLGKRTGLEHLRAILDTRAARDAGREALEAADRLKRRALDDDSPPAPRGSPVVPRLPRHPAPPNAAIAAARDAPDASL